MRPHMWIRTQMRIVRFPGFGPLERSSGQLDERGDCEGDL